jgi:hypothetical protein
MGGWEMILKREISKLKLLTIWGPELFRFRGFRKSKTDMICKVVIKDDITIYELAYLWSNIGGLGSPSTGVYITADQYKSIPDTVKRHLVVDER